jgi:hypothetical protein
VNAFFIPRWHPATVNQLLGHWAKAHRLKRSDRALIAAYGRQVPKATEPRRVQLTIVLQAAQRAADPDAYFKSSLDGLVHAGLLIDDNRQHVELMPVRFDRSTDWGTLIDLEDI